MKKVIIAGGTGLIGRHLSSLLIKSGYEVIILTRNPDKYKTKSGLTFSKIDYSGNNLAPEIFQDAFSVINLSGSGIAAQRWTPEYKKELYNSRIIATKYLVNSINLLEKPPKSFISASAVGIYGDRKDEKINENSQVRNTFLASLCRDWESEADKCRSRVVKARMGVILAKDGGALPKLIQPYKFFVGGAIGTGNQWFPWIHIDDICNMFLWSIENRDVTGVLNFVSPNPVTMNEFAESLGKILKRPAFFKVPEFILKIAAGEAAHDLVASLRVYPTESLHLGYKFKFENAAEALENLVK